MAFSTWGLSVCTLKVHACLHSVREVGRKKKDDLWCVDPDENNLRSEGIMGRSGKELISVSSTEKHGGRNHCLSMSFPACLFHNMLRVELC